MENNTENKKMMVKLTELREWLDAGQGVTPDGAGAACYEYEMVPGFVGTESRSVYAEATPLRSSGESEMVANSLPPTGNYD